MPKNGISAPILRKEAVTAPANAKIDPTDRSIPAEIMTKVIPTAMQIFTEIWRITFQRFVTVTNRSEKMAMIKHNKNNAIRGCNCVYIVFRSEEHTSELQSRENLVCRLLLEKKKTTNGIQ